MRKWKIPNGNPYEEPEGSPLNTMPVTGCATLLSFITYNIFSWLQDKKVPDDLIWNAMGTPSLIVLAVQCVVVVICGAISFPCYYAGYLEQYGMNQWKNWVIRALPLLDYLSILLVPELVLKTQRLEGEVPEGSVTSLYIDIEVDSMDDARVDKVPRQLIEPLKCSPIKGYRPSTTWLYVKGADDAIGDSFKTVLASLSIPSDEIGKINILHRCLDYFLVNDWIDSDISRNNLVITAELYDKSNSDFFKSANAFIFANVQLLKDKDTSLYLSHTTDGTPYYLDEIVSTYLSAQQVDISKVKKLWFNPLGKQSKFVLFGGIEDAKTGILAGSRYELEAVAR